MIVWLIEKVVGLPFLMWLIEIVLGATVMAGIGWLSDWWWWPWPQLAAMFAGYLALVWWVTR